VSFARPKSCSDGERRSNLKLDEARIPWRAIAGIGNVLLHDYHEAYPTVLWDTCQKDLKPLKEAVLRIGAVVAGTKKDAGDAK
jgi:uncharacterized protein with HEPN domain